MRITLQNKTGCGDDKPLRNRDLMLTGPDTDQSQADLNIIYDT